MDDTPVPLTRQYKAPPVVERVVSVKGNMDTEAFQGGIESWKDRVSSTFPEHLPEAQWVIGLQKRDDSRQIGSPEVWLGEQEPELRIIDRWWRSDSNSRFLSMKAIEGELTMHLLGQKGNPHRYQELQREFWTWFPQWASHFSVSQCTRLNLVYVNRIALDTTPQLVDREAKAIAVSDVIKIFSEVPGEHQGLVRPYDCEMGVMIDSVSNTRFYVKVVGGSDGDSPVVNVLFQAIAKPKKPFAVEEVLPKLNHLHDIVIEKFEAIFTENAKTSFQPL